MISERGAYINELLMLKWRIPLFRCLASIFSTQPSNKGQTTIEECLNENASVEECSSIMRHILGLCQVLPVGREILACSMAFKEVAFSSICRSAVPMIYSQIQTPNQDDKGNNE